MALVHLLPLCSSEADRPRKPSDEFSEATSIAQSHRRMHFRSASSGKALSAQGGARSLRAKLKRRRKSGASGAGTVDHCELEEWDLEEVGDDYEVRRNKAAYAIRSHSSQRDDAERGNRDEGHRLERHIMAIRTASGDLEVRESPNGLAGERIAALGAALGGSFPLHAIASLLTSPPRPSNGLRSPAGLSSLALLAARAWLVRQGFGMSGSAQRLADVRSALLATKHEPTTATPRHPAAANLWLPVFLLNLERPRTPPQRRDAIERLAMLERAASGCRVR